MATGYTAGIIDGKTETFQDFAKQCMRAFGNPYTYFSLNAK